MKLYNIYDIYTYAVEADTEMFTSPILKELIEDYAEKHKQYDTWVCQNFSSFKIVDIIKTPNRDMYQSFNELFNSFMLVHKFEFEKMKELEELEYDPIENFNGVEEETINRNPNLHYNTNTTNTKGNQKQTTNTDITPDTQSVDVVKSNVPYDIINEREVDKTTTSNSIIKDGHETTKVETDKVIDTVVGDNSETGNEETIRELHRHGNLGVTTSQMMIESSYNLIGKMHLFISIIDKFLLENCVIDYDEDWNDCINGDVF